MGDIQDRLAARAAAFQQTPVPDGGDGDWLPEDGIYQMVIDRFDFVGERELYLKTFLKIAHHAEYEGRTVTTLHSLENEERFGFLKKHLQGCGLDVTTLDFANLESELEKALDTPVEVAVKSKDKDGKTYRNVYVNEALGGPLGSDIPTDLPPNPVAAGRTADDDIMFLWDGPKEYDDRYHAQR